MVHRTLHDISNISDNWSEIMIVKYKTMKHEESRIFGQYASYKELDVTHCCRKMSDLWNDRVHFANVENAEGYMAQVCIEIPTYEGNTELFIDYCPFCGEKISCEETVKVAVKTRKKRKTTTVTESYEEPIK